MGDTRGPKGVVERLQGFLLQIDITQIVIRKTDEPVPLSTSFTGTPCLGLREKDRLRLIFLRWVKTARVGETC
jgi:hypothetical protein